MLIDVGKGFHLKDITRNLHPNTVAFINLKPEVAVLLSYVIHALFLVLNWRQSAKVFLGEILGRLAERESFECSHALFSDDLFPSLSEPARMVKISRWNHKIINDQKESKYQAVFIESRRVERLASGSYKGLPTKYKQGDFWNLFKCVQFDAEKCDLMNLPVRNRRERVRAVVADYLTAMGAETIVRQKKTEGIKPAKPSLPCTCACASCSKCAAKAPTSAPSDGPVLSVRIARAKERGIEIEREMVDLGKEMLNLGNKISQVDNKLGAIATSARVQIKTAVARKAGRGSDYAPDTEARAHGRAALEGACSELRDAASIARQMGKEKHAAKLDELRAGLEQWKLFSNRAGISFEGGQPK